MFGVVYSLNNHPVTASRTISTDYATHGLQVFIDPDTGQFGHPPEQVAQTASEAISAHASNRRTERLILTEQISNKAGGGYNIELGEQYRPSRHRSPQSMQGS